MKHFTKIVVLLVLLAILCPVLIGCSSGKIRPTIVYDKKYVSGTTSETYHRYLVFHADHTGYYETFQIYSDDSVCSGKADFVWRAADDGTIYLFSNVLTLSDEDTRGESKFEYGFSWGMPITFGVGFLIALKDGGNAGSVRKDACGVHGPTGNGVSRRHADRDLRRRLSVRARL